MFVQLIQGRVSDAEELKASLDRWISELAPRAQGWLGTTAGVTDDGTAIAMARFESEDLARKNSDRPEQHQWWMETSKLFSGEVKFTDCREVIEWQNAGSDDAGFVQIVQARIRDFDRMKELSTHMDALMTKARPDIIGGYTAVHGDGRTTDAIYFTSEAEAREGERKELPDEAKQLMDEMMALMDDVTYHDIRKPWLYSRR
jgi:hypothetical protein